MRGLKSAGESLKWCDESKTRLEQMKVLLQKNRDKDSTQSAMPSGSGLVQALQHKIETITSDLVKLNEELIKAQDKAKMGRDSNLESLTQEIEKQKGLIREQIDALDSDILTKPEMQTPNALKELDRIKKKFDGFYNKVKEYQESEDVLEVPHAEIPEVEMFETRFEKRFRLWNNRSTFDEKHDKWYHDLFLEQDAEQIVKDVNDYQTQNIQMKMKLKKGEKDDVLMKFSREVQDVVDHADLIRALGCVDL